MRSEHSQNQNESLQKKTTYRKKVAHSGSIPRKKGKSQKHRLFYALLTGFLLCASLFIFFVTRAIQANRFIESEFPQDVLGVPVYTELVEIETDGRPGTKRQIKYIIIHETANTSQGAAAKAHSIFLNSGMSGTTSWHYTVDDHEIYHHIPDDEIAWHAGDTANPDGGNKKGIGIELCVNEGADFAITRTNAAKLTAWLLNAYELDITAVKQHFDCNEKNCPLIMREEALYDDFIAQVQFYLIQIQSAAAEQETESR